VLDPEEIIAFLGEDAGSSADRPMPAAAPAGSEPDTGGPPDFPRSGVPEMLSAAPTPGPLPPRLAALFREEDAWFPDRLVERLARPPGEVLSELSRLEAEGLLIRLPGGAYALAT
jgi:predicted Rossmann fold nucleotide-binding protein DprA/Smf involved in DNA uptake